jgi:hypothetical protein
MKVVIIMVFREINFATVKNLTIKSAKSPH